MADGDKPILPQFVADVLRAIHRARHLVPEVARAGLDYVQRLKQEEADLSSTTANPDMPSAIANHTTPTVETNPPTPTVAPKTPRRRAKRGEQRHRIERALRKRFSPYGLPPPGSDHEAVTKKVISVLDEEKATGSAPKEEEHLDNPSPDAVADTIEHLRAAAKIEGYSANPSRRSR